MQIILTKFSISRTEKGSTGIRPCDVTVVLQVQKAIELLVHGERTTWLFLCSCRLQPIQHRLQHFWGDDDDGNRSMSCAQASVKNQIKAIILSISLSFLTLTSNNFIQTLANLHTTRNFSHLALFKRFYSILQRTTEREENEHTKKNNKMFWHKVSVSSTKTRQAKNNVQLVIWIWNENYENLRDEVTTAHAITTNTTHTHTHKIRFFYFTRFIYDYYQPTETRFSTDHYSIQPEHLKNWN